ncbi:MAG TPA: DUF4145 domain-containing protein [Prolixibacteraceae bacterium]|nr:DUF4145 domain-containing protein [Prolixibacteraceae bacterium]
MNEQSTKILRCYNCGNETRQVLVHHYVSYIMYDEIIMDGKLEKVNNDFHYYNFKCSTCSGLNIIGGFDNEIDIELDKYKRLYPIGPNLRIPDHQILEKQQPVPEEIIKIYEEIWFLRKQVPNAFANQIRKCLEMICNDNGANGRTLNDKLKDLKNKGLLPGTNEELVKIIREVGNLGSHASGHELDIWDVELLDEFFKTVIDYIYVVPMKMKRLNQRLSAR